MPGKTDSSTTGFEWRLLPEFSDLLNRLGPHGFRVWPAVPAELQLQLEVLRVDPEQEIVLLWSDNRLCGYAISLHERDIDRTVSAVAVTSGCTDRAGPLVDWVIERAASKKVSRIHIALRNTPVEPIKTLKERGFKRVTASLELTLDRADAAGLTDFPLPDGFSIRTMRSSAETLLLTRMQNTIFSKHWGFSKNTPEEIQARLDLPESGPEHVLFVESPDGSIAAYIWTALEWRDQHTGGKIWMTGVMPEFRRSGIGSSIVSAGVRHLLAEGVAQVHLEAVAHNAAAVRIYTQMGFKEAGRVEWYELEL